VRDGTATWGSGGTLQGKTEKGANDKRTISGKARVIHILTRTERDLDTGAGRLDKGMKGKGSENSKKYKRRRGEIGEGCALKKGDGACSNSAVQQARSLPEKVESAAGKKFLRGRDKAACPGDDRWGGTSGTATKRTPTHANNADRETTPGGRTRGGEVSRIALKGHPEVFAGESNVSEGRTEEKESIKECWGKRIADNRTYFLMLRNERGKHGEKKNGSSTLNNTPRRKKGGGPRRIKVGRKKGVKQYPDCSEAPGVGDIELLARKGYSSTRPQYTGDGG